MVGEGRKGRLPASGHSSPLPEHQLLFPPEQESVDHTTNGGLRAMKFYNSVILWGSKEGAVGVNFWPFSGICEGKDGCGCPPEMSDFGGAVAEHSVCT